MSHHTCKADCYSNGGHLQQKRGTHKKGGKIAANLERRRKVFLEWVPKLDEKQARAVTMPGSGKRG